MVLGLAARVSSVADPSPFLRRSRDCSPFLGGDGAKAAAVLVAIVGDFFFICFEGAEASCSPCREFFGVFLRGSIASES